MPGGKGMIRGADNPKPFTKDYNGADFTKWTEEKVHIELDKLIQWLLEEKDVIDDRGLIVGKVDNGNVFYKEFLYKNGLFEDWITHMKKRYSTASNKIDLIDKIQEMKLQKLAFNGKGKENITKFILQNKHGWSERSETKVDQVNTNLTLKDLISFDDE